MSKVCPTHNTVMFPTSTRFGDLYHCPVDGCDMKCWGGSTSTPADAETREARQHAKVLFRRLWIPEDAPFTKSKAYKWLARAMDLPGRKAHIGMFTADQCKELVFKLNDLLGVRTDACCNHG